MSEISVLILTYNEERHIVRAIRSVSSFADQVVVIDSFSTDNTVRLSEQEGAMVLQHKFINQAQQIRWAMGASGIASEWIMRLDADEYVTKELAEEISLGLSGLPSDVNGILLKRRLHFMGRWIRHGGFYPVAPLRVWRNGKAEVESRMMDEHMYLLSGRTIQFRNDIVDDNLNSLSWWIAKHNQYATREAAEWLGQRFHFLLPQEKVLYGSGQVENKRWIKRNMYDRMPLLFRAFVYFLYRYWIQLGFLDGKPGLVWHFLQGFWYRFLVDAKILQVIWMSQRNNLPVKQVLIDEFGLQWNDPDQVDKGK